MNIKLAKFNIGQIVRHSESGYRGVIVDIDPEFAHQSINLKADKGAQKYQSEPWYHVLLEEQNMQAYVAEKQLQQDNLGEPIDHAYVDEFFTEFEQDHYVVRKALN